MEMLSVFTDVLHVSNISQPQHLGAILDQNDAFTKQEVILIEFTFLSTTKPRRLYMREYRSAT